MLTTIPKIMGHKYRYEWRWEPPRKRTVFGPTFHEFFPLQAPGIVFATVYNQVTGHPFGLFVYGRDEPLTSEDDEIFMVHFPGGQVLDWTSKPYAAGMAC